MLENMVRFNLPTEYGSPAHVLFSMGKGSLQYWLNANGNVRIFDVRQLTRAFLSKLKRKSIESSTDVRQR
jgi:hypothetical protein